MPVDWERSPDAPLRAVGSLSEAFEARSIRYALIGELAFVLRGRPRFTLQGVNFLIDVPQIALAELLDDLIGRGATLDPTVVSKEYARESMTSFRFGGVRVNGLRPVLSFYARTLVNAAPVEGMEGRTIRVATAEGLIPTKIVAFRLEDQIDVENLLIANRDAIDVDLVRREWTPFAAAEPERTAWLEAEIERRVVRRG